MLNYDRRQRKPSFLALCGGLLASASIALSAYAAHGMSDAHAQSNLQTAALYAFGHGIALAALAAGTSRTMGKIALVLLLLGTLLFAGSLVLSALAGLSTQAAPVGGVMLILGWAIWAFDAVRR